MNGYLLDTNVISEYSRKKSPDERLRKWVDSQNEATLYLSVLTLGEIRKGIRSDRGRRHQARKANSTGTGQAPMAILRGLRPSLNRQSDRSIPVRRVLQYQTPMYKSPHSPISDGDSALAPARAVQFA